MKRKTTAPGRKAYTQEDAQRANEKQFERYQATVADAKATQVPLIVLDVRHMTFENIEKHLGGSGNGTMFDALHIMFENMQNMGMCKFIVLSNYMEYYRAHQGEPGTPAPTPKPRTRTPRKRKTGV